MTLVCSPMLLDPLRVCVQMVANGFYTEEKQMYLLGFIHKLLNVQLISVVLFQINIHTSAQLALLFFGLFSHKLHI